MSTRAIETPARGIDPSRDDVRSSPVQWSAVFAGTLAGFAATVILGTLGVALGVSIGAVVADEPMTRTDAGRTALGFGVGSAIWAILTAAIVGCIGGTVLRRCARRDRPYLPVAFAALTWAGGVVLALFLASSGSAGLMSGASGAAAAAVSARPQEMSRAVTDAATPRAANPEVQRAPMTEEDRVAAREAAEKASQAAAAAAWVVLGAQLISLAATMLAARWKTERREHPYAMGAPSAT
jgi:hypothetical protein